MKVNPIFILFAVIYNIITAILVLNMLKDQSASLGYMLIFFPVFWIISAIILFLLNRKKIIDFQGITNKILFIFSTPFALLLSYFIYVQLSDAKYIMSTYEYDKVNYRHREVTYDYKVAGQTQRKEFFIFDAGWKKDSIWKYYNKDGSIKKVEDYRNNKNQNSKN